jgi:hypothetical protein
MDTHSESLPNIAFEPAQTGSGTPTNKVVGNAAKKANVEPAAETITSAEEQNIKSVWTALQVAEKQTEKRGLQFGQAMYEYREKHSASGRRTDLVSSETRLETFEEFCDRLNIPRATAYRWIAKYEESIGTRLPKPTPDNCPNKTTSYEVKVEAEPTAQVSSRNVSPSEDSSSMEDDLLPESEPVPTPPASTPPPVVTTEKRDLEQLGSLAHRMGSVTHLLQAGGLWLRAADDDRQCFAQGTVGVLADSRQHPLDEAFKRITGDG